MVSTKQDCVYIISYLLSECEEEEVVGYSNLASRIYYLQQKLEMESQISGRFRDALRELVLQSEDELDWSGLKMLLDEKSNDQLLTMFISIGTEEIEPGKWQYKFSSKAPNSVLEVRLEEMGDNNKRLIETIRSVARTGEEEVFQEVYGV